MRGGKVKTVTLVGCRVQLLYFPAGLPQQLFVLENEKSGDLLIRIVSLVVHLITKSKKGSIDSLVVNYISLHLRPDVNWSIQSKRQQVIF